MTMHRVLGALVLFLGFATLAVSPAAAATVKLTVNGDAITDVQIAQRMALKKLEHVTGQKAALDELINEALQVQEAKRLGFTIAETDVDDALLQLARQLKLSSSNLTKVLTNNGVGMQTLRDRLKANIAWSKVSATAISSPSVTVSEADIDKEAKAKLTPENSYDYILKEVLFLTVPRAARQRQRSAPRRLTSTARASRVATAPCSYPSPTPTLPCATSAVATPTRCRMPSPTNSASSMSAASPSRASSRAASRCWRSAPRKCRRTPPSSPTNLRQNAGNGALKTEADKYLADLKAKAQIVYS